MSKIILVADDDGVNRELLKKRLTETGYNVLTASDGVEALAVIAKQIPDLIILDVEMPNMNGYAFMQAKKKISAYANIPVIMLTSHEETEPIFKRYGVRSYFIKPLNMQLLLDKLAEVLK
jgi:CheY-like chemotaxis protein